MVLIVPVNANELSLLEAVSNNLDDGLLHLFFEDVILSCGVEIVKELLLSVLESLIITA